MINNQLINPQSIVVVGGSNNLQKPGGKVLYNIISNNYKGKLYVVNPKEKEVQGIQSFTTIQELPENIDLAILAIPSNFCKDAVKELAFFKNTKAFIILSAGFSEESEAGAKLEKEIVEIISSTKGCLIGPNCIGVLTANYAGVFTTPIPSLDQNGCDFISGSGATAVFIMESGIPKGLRFSSIFSVGNSAQIGVEEVLEYLDENFDPDKSSKIKLLYLESIKNPSKLLKHAHSLIKKGCFIVAIKAGSSEAGSRAASSHTGAMASPDIFVDALMKKAGIIRCNSRDEITNVASILQSKKLTGKRFAIITHAGGPAVMLTDALSNNGYEVPLIEGQHAQELLSHLYPGSSVKNPIDFLATGTAEQLDKIIDYCENYFNNIDAMAVIFGSPGLFPVDNVYNVLHNKMRTCKKPIYPILPSVINASNEIKEFIKKNNVFFPDEVVFANSLKKVYSERIIPEKIVDYYNIENIKCSSYSNGYLPPEEVKVLLKKYNIPIVDEYVVYEEEDLIEKFNMLSLPVVMKIIGPIHKTDVGGVILNIDTKQKALECFRKLMSLKDAKGVLIQPMLSGIELYIGAIRNEQYGHLVMFGIGGVFIEVYRDVVSCLCPVTKEEALFYLKQLRAYKILEGYRNKKGVNIDKFAEIIVNVSDLLVNVPEIYEMDINPLIANENEIYAVDTRIRIEK
ncbi:MAG: acetate--CoA ligase family protein [Bacteroidales bacterium]|nr:acetate--CoA ligase family protein [Bacteroidales bacterium]